MSAWPSHPLGDLAEVVMGQSPPGDTYNVRGNGLPFFQGKAEFGDVHPMARKWCSQPRRIALAGDILISVRAPVGPTNVASSTCCIGRGLAAIRTNRFLLEPTYLRYYLRHEEDRLAALGQGSTFASIGRAELTQLGVPLPPLDEQRRIVDILSRAEGIVRLRREAQKKAAELVPAIFLEMFGDPATNPKGWPIRPLGEIADVQGGLQVTSARAALPLEVPYLRVANVHRGRLDLGEVKMLRVAPHELARASLATGDLLIVEGHGNPLEIGRVAVWDGSIPDCTHQNHLIRARPVPSMLLPEYASACLNSHGGRQALLRSGKTTSGLSTISVKNVKHAPIMAPPIALQQKFAVATRQTLALQHAQRLSGASAAATMGALLRSLLG